MALFFVLIQIFLHIIAKTTYKKGKVMELKGTKTEQNLRAAFSGESEARNKYTYFASVAKKEGYEQIAEIFGYTAKNSTVAPSSKERNRIGSA